MPCTAWGGARMTWAIMLYSLSSLPALTRRVWSEAILHSGDVLGLPAPRPASAAMHVARAAPKSCERHSPTRLRPSTASPSA